MIVNLNRTDRTDRTAELSSTIWLAHTLSLTKAVSYDWCQFLHGHAAHTSLGYTRRPAWARGAHWTLPVTVPHQRLDNLLVDFHGFRHADISDERMLFALVCDPHAWPVSRGQTSTPPTRVIELPVHASSFFSPDWIRQWESNFHSTLWHSIGTYERSWI